MSSSSAPKEPREAPPNMIGRVLDGRFRIDALLGEGGLGQVFRGTHLRLGRAVAIKVMHAHHVTRNELRTRFDREARSLAKLAHPNVVGVIDYGVDGELPFLVMDLLEGRTLEQAIHEGLPGDRVVPVFRDVLRAVAYAHGVGLVHRDLKPANVFLQQVPEIGEVVRVLDFGLAKFVDGEGSNATVTRAGMVIGTPAYMSPEQATASIVDARADVYSLGVVLFEMITGRRPFTGTDGAEVLRMHLLQPLPEMSSIVPGSPLVPLLDPIVKRATEKSKADRFADAAEMATALDAAVGRASTPPVAAPAPPRAGGAAAGASIHVTISDVPVSVATGPRKTASASGASTAPRSWLVPALGLIVVLVVVVAYALGSSGETRSPPSSIAVPPTTIAAPPTTTAPPPSSAPDTIVVPPPSTLTPPPSVTEVATTPDAGLPDPWADPLPPQLVAAATRVRADREITADQRTILFRYSSNHPHDPRGLLLLGHAEVNAHALTDACHRYRHAWQVDPNARFDATMRHDLVTIATRESTAEEAGALVREIYGAEALPEIEVVRSEVGSDRAALARLDRLRASITPVP